MKTGRVLITGGTGFVGRRLVKACLASGRPVTVATRSAPARLQPGIRYVETGDIGPETDWRDVLAGAEAVVHLAGHVHVAPERADRQADLFDRVNHLASVRLFDAAADAGIARFVFMSSVTVLGDGTAPGNPFHDGSPPDPRTPYARSKLAAETALTERAKGRSTSLFILRPPLICGPQVGGNLGALLRLSAAPVPLPFGSIDNRRTLLALDNLVSAVEALLDHPDPGSVAGSYVLGDRAPVSTTEIVAGLRDGMGRPRWLVPVPPAALAAASRLLGGAGMVRRLLGDLEVESSRFRRVLSWTDRIDTRTALIQAGRAFRR